MMWDMAEAHITGLKAWADRQHSIAVALERHRRRRNDGEVYDNCKFKMKDLRGADLTGADLFEADLTGADLFGADLTGAELRHANLRHANLRHANLRHAKLRGWLLGGLEMSSADLRHAKYNEHTLFPDGFDPVARELIEVSE